MPKKKNYEFIVAKIRARLYYHNGTTSESLSELHSLERDVSLPMPNCTEDATSDTESPDMPLNIANDPPNDSFDPEEQDNKLPLEASLPPTLLAILHSIRRSSFRLEDQHEPNIGTDEADIFLGNDPHFKREVISKLNGRSIYFVFLEKQYRKCCFCGCIKSSSLRAVACVRSHLNHRPFHCPGNRGGCKKCTHQNGYARFFSKALLRDHLTGQTQKYECAYEGCTASLRRGGMKRHWDTQHKNADFPSEVYPRYHSVEDLNI